MNSVNKEYDREKTLAVVTGIVCFLIFLCGTSLGAYHSFSELGAIGILSVACYLIADVAICWAAFIDYKEDGNGIEWTAWAVKYILSLYLLFSGGCIAYLMIQNSHNEKQVQSRSRIFQSTYGECMGKPKARQSECRKLAESFNNTQSNTEDKEKQEKTENNKTIETYINWPLFKYMPGILGLFGLIGLTLAVKLIAEKSDVGLLLNQFQQGNRKVYQKLSQNQAPFKVPLHNRQILKFEQGIEAFTLYPQQSGFRVHDQTSTYVGHISFRKFEKANPQTLDDIKRLI